MSQNLSSATVKICALMVISFFLEKDTILCILKGTSPFKMHKIIFFTENLKKIIGFTSKFMYGRFCLFDLILYVHSTIFQLCGTCLPGLNQC